MLDVRIMIVDDGPSVLRALTRINYKSLKAMKVMNLLEELEEQFPVNR